MSDLILNKYGELPKEVEVKVLEYIEFLMSKHQKKDPKRKNSKKKSNFGSAKGTVLISDDFDAPLDDFKDYM